MLGVTMPSSMKIAGRSFGMCDKHSNPDTSYSCFMRNCKDKQGHEKWECPAAFALKYPGRVMPGWTAEGTRDPAAWNGDDTTQETRDAWAELIAEGFFAQHPSPDTDFPFPDPTKPGGGRQ